MYRTILSAVGWFFGTMLFILMFYPIIYSNSWTTIDAPTFATHLLGPALVFSGLSLMASASSHDKTPISRLYRR